MGTVVAVGAQFYAVLGIVLGVLAAIGAAGRKRK
jgi:hypothetical protein